MRESAREIVSRAQEAGMACAEDLLRRTPLEIEGEFRARAAQVQREAQNADLLAWLIGRYTLFAVHAPRRFPAAPDGVRAAPRDMDAAQMKQVFADIAARREKEYGNR